MTRSARRRLLAAVVLGTSLASPHAGSASGEQGGALDVLASAQAAWAARDVEAYLALWEFDDPRAQDVERRFIQAQFAEQESRLLFVPPETVPPARQVVFVVRSYAVSEPRGRVEQWGLVVRRTPAGWRLVARHARGRLDGLVHLVLDPAGYRADGLTLQLEDFELRMLSGTLFTTTASLGPTAMVFVGRGLVKMTPRLATEREQLRRFAGRPTLEEKVERAFVRLHPADLHRVLRPTELRADPQAGRRLGQAQRFFQRQARESFTLDSGLPGAPWWVLPSPGDALVDFRTRRGVLTYTLSRDRPEAITLFKREQGTQICSYPLPGGDTHYSEDDGRQADALHHALKVRLEPASNHLQVEDRLRLRLLRDVHSLNLTLNRALTVRSVSSAAGRHMFLRVRKQDTLVVSLGAASAGDELTLTVKYDGRLPDAASLEDALQVTDNDSPLGLDAGPHLQPIRIISSRSRWYPQPGAGDFARADVELDVPEAFLGVSGGRPNGQRVVNGRRISSWSLQQPGKYVAVAAGRLRYVAERQAGGVRLRAYATPRRQRLVAETLQRAAAILELFEKRFGPCPYPDVNVVLVEGRVPGGHSPPGLIVLAARPPSLRERLAPDPATFHDVPGFFLAHELAHQWWGHGVAGQNYRESWISEGFAQYAAALWVEHSRGPRGLRNVLGRLGRWAIDRSHEGPLHLGRRLGHVRRDRQAYRAVIYNKGAYVLHMLRGLLGDEPFFEALQALQTRHAFGKLGSEDVRRSLEEASRLDLEPYFRAWVYDTRLPRLEVRQRRERTASGYRRWLDVLPTDLPGPVPLELTPDDGGPPRRVMLDPAGGSWSFDSVGKTGKVKLNQDRGLLVRIVER